MMPSCSLYRRVLLSFVLCLSVSILSAKQRIEKQDRVVVAYVTSWTNVLPDPSYMTHINYAFALVNDAFDGIRIANPERLRRIVALRQEAPHLRVLLSVGGWGAGGFSEMAGDEARRRAFAQDCLRAVEEFGLDGIDIDWEYPTQSMAGIASSPADTENFTLLMRDLRKVLGRKRLLTCATAARGEYVDFRSCIRYLDLVNVMAYDMGDPPYHHAPLYASPISGWMTMEKAVAAHLEQGVPAHKLVVGMPFYGRGEGTFRHYHRGITLPDSVQERWSQEAQVPYLARTDGTLVCGFDDARSLALKCQYILDQQLRGGMYWEYADDTPQGDKRRTLQESLLKQGRGVAAPRRVLAIAERGNAHEAFSLAALDWLDARKDSLHIEVTRVDDLRHLPEGTLKQYHLILQLDYPPFNWSVAAQQDFRSYIENSLGGYVGFHHATLLGDIFGAGAMWEWFSDFMGKVRWKNYVPEPADGTICIEDATHPVTRGVPDTLRLPHDEWYTYHQSPRPHVHVLAHVDEHSYAPASQVRMGDHPVIWTNRHKAARNVYFQFGHDAALFKHPGFVQLFDNAVRWALGDVKDE